MTQIAETERLVIREIDESDAAFMNALLNSPGFLKYIGDRGVHSDDDARRFISERYRKSYADNGYGLYAVLLKDNLVPVGMCGFVRRDTLPGPDLGFAFLPEHEGKGYGHESSIAVLRYGREELGFERVLAITTLDNRASMRLLEKLGFTLDKVMETPDGECLNVFSTELDLCL
jgi:ribosomal-protein-alanine N-acetyltransferase